jgi:hypothetical protein
MTSTLRLLASCSLLLAFLAAGCGARQRIDAANVDPTTGLVAQSGGPPMIRAAVIRALGARRYQVYDESGQQIVATYERGRHFLQVTITYDATSFHIAPAQIEGMNERHWARYARELERTIQDELVRAEREARPRVIAVAQPQPQYVVVGGGGGGGVVAGGVVAGGGVAGGGGVVVGGGVGVGVVRGGSSVPYGTSCEQIVLSYNQPGTIHCRPDTDVYCASALLSMGHPTTSLLFCSSVEPNCAQNHLLSGGAPTALMRCRY